MSPRTFTLRQALATLGASLGLLLLAGPAGAAPDGDAVSRYLANNGTDQGQAYHATRIGIPDDVAAAIARNHTAEPLVIPYLSHGTGVTVDEDGLPASEPTFVGREQPDGSQPQLRGADRVATSDSGVNWETTGYVAGGIVGAMLLALLSTLALRDRRGLRSA